MLRLAPRRSRLPLFALIAATILVSPPAAASPAQLADAIGIVLDPVELNRKDVQVVPPGEGPTLVPSPESPGNP